MLCQTSNPNPWEKTVALSYIAVDREAVNSAGAAEEERLFYSHQEGG